MVYFFIGNVQGREQKHGSLGYIGDDYILRPLQQGRLMVFNVTGPLQREKGLYRYLKQREDVSCGQRCPMLWNALGRWVDGQWLLYHEGKIEQNPFVSALKDVLIMQLPVMSSS